MPVDPLIFLGSVAARSWLEVKLWSQTVALLESIL